MLFSTVQIEKNRVKGDSLKKNKSRLLINIVIVVLCIALIFVLNGIKNYDTKDVLSKFGSKSEEVKSIQTVLKNKGYYEASIDGIFGEKTKAAVINFQKDNNLVQDGIVGSKTLKALGIGESKNSSKYSDSEINLLARVISAESRGEPYSGQVAVGGVILNRIEHPSFPDTLSGVIYQPGAFSCLNDGQINQAVDESAKRAAVDAINGLDPSCGAIYYYNPAKTTNSFMLSRPVLTVIGKHRFCK